MKSNKKQMKNDNIDIIWRKIMYDYAEYEGQILEEKIESLKNNPQFQPSEEETQWFYKFIDEYFKNKNNF